MEQMHSLLTRQLRRHLGHEFSVPEEWQGLITAISEAYEEFGTDRRMLERSLELSSQELLQANSELRALLQAVPDLIFRLDGEGTILSCDSGDTTHFFLKPQLLIGKRIQDFPLWSQGEKFEAAIREVQATQSIVQTDYWMMLEEQVRYYEARFLPLHQNQLMVIIRDITEQKRSAEELHKSRERYRLLAENSPFALVAIAQDGTFEYVNPKFKEVFGYDLSDVPNGRAWSRQAYPDPVYRHKVISAWIDSLERLAPGESTSRVFTVTCKDGSEKIIHFRPVKSSTGPDLITCQDITARMRAEQELLDSEERLRAVVYGSMAVPSPNL